MSNKIEAYIKTNKKAFDTAEPPAGLWDKIDAELSKKKISKPFRLQLWVGIAATILLICGLGYFYVAKTNTASGIIAEVNPGYAKKEMRFASLIEEKRDSLEVFAKDNPELYQKFAADLEKLDGNYKSLKKELPDSPNQKLVVKAMVKNLELQLQLISQQLTIINQVQQFKKDNQI